ncbi:MAG TPA: ATP-binding cassette domain-containing protein [Terriglobales bacterium]|nr:ATP-binding cassette domain-containing protein [Terriglobales bacterium]
MHSAIHPVVSFSKVDFTIDGRTLLRNITLSAYPGETIVLLGRSGAGKTTLLMLANRMLEPTRGQVMVEGVPTLQWDAITLRRRIGYVIQEVGLFPHITIERNIAVVPELENWPRTRIQNRVAELLQIVGMKSEVASRYPRQLSGGQRQRAGVARALAADPPVLLMDEPFGALDPLTRAEMQRELAAMQQRLQKTILFVTHDLREALVLASRIVLMDEGEIVLTATPEEFQLSKHPLAVAYMSAFQTGGTASP